MSGESLRVIFAIATIAFLIGSVPFGLFVVKAFRGTDIRKEGSGNVGATNVSRIVGFFPAGLITLLLDVAKGAVPVFVIQQQFLADAISNAIGFHGTLDSSAAWITGLAAVLGHCFSPWLNFRGGKGVATAFGVFLVLAPAAAAIGAISFALVFRDTRTGSLSSLAGSLMCLVGLAVLSRDNDHLFVASAILFVILLRHESNMDAMLEGKENVFR